jgi:hypothetical protein
VEAAIGMHDRQANALETVVGPAGRGPHRHTTYVRRRRSRKVPRQGRWVAARSRTRMVRTAVLCTSVLLLMVLGLYLGLSRQDSPHGEGAGSPVVQQIVIA